MSGKFAVVPAAATDDARLSASDLRVLATLATYADGNGYCLLPPSTIGHRLGMTGEAVSEHLLACVKAGYLEVIEYVIEDGVPWRNGYQLLPSTEGGDGG